MTAVQLNTLLPIFTLAKAKGVTMGVSARSLTKPSLAIDMGNQLPYKAASTIKMGLASLIMHNIDSGKWSLDTRVHVSQTDIIGGSGILQDEPAPQTVTLERLLRLMITVSDNTATNILIDYVGGFTVVNKFTVSLGLSDSGFHFGRKMMETGSGDKENWITPMQDANLLSMIYNSTFLSAAASSQLITWMRMQTVNTKFGAVVPRAYLANKTGELPYVSHDTGYLLYPGKEMVLSVMTAFNEGLIADANTLVQKVAQAVFDYQRN